MIKNRVCRSIVVSLLITMPIIAQFHTDAFSDNRKWYFVTGMDAGIAIIGDAGQDQTFPAVTIGSDEFYIYQPNNQTITPAIYGGFLGVEWRGCDRWNLQFDVNYNQSSAFPVTGKLTQGIDAQSESIYDYGYSIRARQLLAEFKAEYIHNKNLCPYLLFGLGASFNGVENYYTNIPSTLVLTRAYENNSIASCSYALGAGLDFDIKEHFSLSVGYRFTNLGKVSFGTSRINGTAVAGTLSQPTLYANEIVVQLILLF